MLSLRLGPHFSRMSSCVYDVLVKLPPGGILLSAQGPPSSEMEVAAIPLWLRILVMVLRALFFGALPWGSRCVCGSWPIFFMFPKRADVYRAYRIGLVVTPLALAMAIAVWQ